MPPIPQKRVKPVPVATVPPTWPPETEATNRTLREYIPYSPVIDADASNPDLDVVEHLVRAAETANPALQAAELAGMLSVSRAEFKALIKRSGLAPAALYPPALAIGLGAAYHQWVHVPSARAWGALDAIVQAFAAMPPRWFTHWVAAFDGQTHFSGRIVDGEPELRDPVGGEVLFNVRKCYFQVLYIVAARNALDTIVKFRTN